MGLDISSFRAVVRMDNPTLNEDNEPIDPETGDWMRNTVRVYENTDFPGRASPLVDGHYTFAESVGGPSLAYGSYNKWREELARMAGYEAKSVTLYGVVEVRHAASAWAATSGPFWELINFSDCEGVIGPIASAKLAKDFSDFEERARSFQSTAYRFYETYLEFREVFEFAKDGGFVDFH